MEHKVCSELKKSSSNNYIKVFCKVYKISRGEDNCPLEPPFPFESPLSENKRENLFTEEKRGENHGNRRSIDEPGYTFSLVWFVMVDVVETLVV